MVKRIAVAILLLPLAEIAAFVMVATVVGVTCALLLMLASTLAGILVLRSAGRAHVAGFGAAAAKAAGGEAPDVQAAAGGFLTVLAGALLLVPGLLTSLFGALLLIRPVQRAFGERIRAWLVRRPADRGTVDLEPGEWQRVPDRELSNHSRRE
jgi:UPF0716 protein FxsA